MPDLSAAIQEMLNGRLVRVGHLVELQFETTSNIAPVYLWNGLRTINVGGNDYVGLRELGSIDGLEEEGDNLQATELRLSVSGVDPGLLNAAIAEDRGSFIGKLAFVRLQFFDADWQLLGDPIERNASIIDGIEIDWSVNDDGSQTRALTVTAQNIFYGRSVPPAGNYSNRDQQFRSPGDRGFEYVGNVPGRVTQVPW